EEDIISPRKEKISITQETKAGVLPVNIYFKDSICEKVMMTQGRLVSKDMKLKVEKIAKALNIKNNEIDTFLPQKMVSTGLFTLPICVKSFDILQAMKPNFDYIKTICMEKRFGSFHVFTFETIEKTSAYHARNFAPYYGINEDPVTGTANGAVTAFLVKNGIIRQKQLVCEQGDIIGRPGRVQVEIKDDIVMVGGKAKLVEEKEIEV
ncbi:MAG: PhzF family phenazine biosynthesis protein, partial [Petrotogales bacterium]